MPSSEKAFVRELNDQPEYQRLLGGKPETCGMRSGRVYLEPGKDCGQHSTEGHEELLVFLAGAGEVEIGGSDRLGVCAGKVAYIPPQTAHNVRNTGPEPLIYIFCVAPANQVS